MVRERGLEPLMSKTRWSLNPVPMPNSGTPAYSSDLHHFIYTPMLNVAKTEELMAVRENYDISTSCLTGKRSTSELPDHGGKIYIASHSSSEYRFISVALRGNPSASHHFRIALSVTPQSSPILVNGVVRIRFFNSALVGRSAFRRNS